MRRRTGKLGVVEGQGEAENRETRGGGCIEYTQHNLQLLT